MLAGISITCFAASYAVALLLETTRLFFRSGVRGALMLGFGGAGLLAHTLFLAYRATMVVGTPLSSEFDWYLIAAWCLAATYLYLTLYHPRTAFGLFVLPLVLGLIGVAKFFADPTPFPGTKAAQIWGMVHGVFFLLGTVAVVVGFASGVMCLVQARRLKHKLGQPQGLRLPSLEWLERTNTRAIIVSVVMLGAGFVSGIVLNLVHYRLHIDELPWDDSIVWSWGVLLAWLLAAAGFSFFYKPARKGRKVAYLTVASFVFLVLSIGMQFLVPTEHARTAANASHEQPSSSLPPSRGGGQR
jgi:ABC-type uncharacterized transport system permease subunit